MNQNSFMKGIVTQIVSICLLYYMIYDPSYVFRTFSFFFSFEPNVGNFL